MSAYKYIVTSLFLTIIGFQVTAQAPYINDIDITSGTFGQVVTISGSNFSSNPADLIVMFGSAQGTIQSASESLIEVLVPAGATVENVSVINTSGSNTKIGYSNSLFNISFGGSKGVASTFDGQQLINEVNTDISTYDLCLCDFDKDGLNDIAVTNSGSNNLVVQKNNSTPAATAFTRSGDLQLSLSFSTINTVCGDINGDGWPDLIATQGGSSNNRIFILKNQGNGTVDFAAPIELSIPKKSNGDIRFVRRVALQDLDLDGKPEIIVTNTSDNIIDVFKNNSVQSGISISSISKQFTVQASDSRSAGLVGLDVKDMNNDGLPEIVTSFNRLSNVYVLPNTSEPGTISFDPALEISASGGFQNLKVADMNQDGYNDVVLTAGTAGTPANAVVIIKNTTSSPGSTITMESAATISGITSPWGLDVGDIDGDGTPDIAVASVGSPGKVFLLIADNPASFTYNVSSLNSQSNSRNIKIGDLNGDAKPDLAFTHNVTDGSEGELAVIMNRNCVIPSLFPAEDVEVCKGQVYKLTTANSPSATYTWKRNGLNQAETSNVLTVPTTDNGTYNFTVTVTDQGCTQVSESVQIKVQDGSISAPNPSSSAGTATVCSGTEVTLMTGQTFASYEWTGPNGYASTLQNPVIASIAQDMSGKYKVTGRDANGCLSETKEVTVTVENLPVIAVNNDEQDIFCDGSTATVSVTNFGTDYTYKWKKDGADIPGETATTLSVSASGDYSSVITSTGGCSFESPSRTLTAIAKPDNSIATDPADGVICEDLAITFSTTPGDQNGQPVTHTWDFGDGSPTQQGASVSHTYQNPSTPTVTLTSTYTNLANCSASVATKTITVQGVPNTANGATVNITTSTGDTAKCPSDELTLTLADNYTGYSWASSLQPGVELSTTNTVNAERPVKGDATATYTATATDDAGCQFTASIDISLKSTLGITIETAEETTPGNDGVPEINLKEDQLSVDLSVANATGISWAPEEIFDNPTAENVTVIPNSTNILVKVTGTDPGGCLESDSIRIINPIVRAKRVFSPNGDGIGEECWEITNARDINGCTLFIFDSKGQIIKQEEINKDLGDDCMWDGTHNGMLLPEGIYYYALKCNNTQTLPSTLSGSILLGR